MAAVLTTLSTVANVVTTIKGIHSLVDRAHESSSDKHYQRGVHNLTKGMEKLNNVRDILKPSEVLELTQTHDELHDLAVDVEQKIDNARSDAALGVKNPFRNEGVKGDAKKFEKDTKRWSTKAKRSSARAMSQRLRQQYENRLPPPDTVQGETQEVQMPPSYADSSHSDDHQVETDQAPPSVQQEQDLGLASLSTRNAEQPEANPLPDHKQHAF
ncbi:unnamed protein product [Somion occarium]|uniref:Fungal N-terminal domain-containing protein n=1 Tax=Somion occarium TaxID=3059160 RepID=A0ABP1DEN5_9APHY